MGIKSVARAVWDGPFHMGKLEKPVSAGDAILKLFEVIWRIFVIIASLMIVAFVVAAGIIAFEPTSSYDPHDHLSMSVVYGGNGCHNPTPVAVYMRNNSDKPIEKYTFRIAVKAKGHSSDLSEGSLPVTSDQILGPSQELVFCQEIPALTDNSYPVNELVFEPGTYYPSN